MYFALVLNLVDCYAYTVITDVQFLFYLFEKWCSLSVMSFLSIVWLGGFVPILYGFVWPTTLGFTRGHLDTRLNCNAMNRK